MAHHSANAVNWFLAVPKAQKDLLGGIRHWSTLKIAFDDDLVWVSGFDATQIASVTVQSIPYKRIYYSNNDKLFRQDSLLPERPIPALLWTPIERAIPVEFPPFRGNYTDNQDPIAIHLVPAENDQETAALLINLTDLAAYIETASAIRLQVLRWALIDSDKALLIGTPVLPLPGNALWQQGDFLLPVGYRIDLFVVTDLLNASLNPDGHDWIVWQQDSCYFRVAKKSLNPLSISSFRASITS